MQPITSGIPNTSDTSDTTMTGVVLPPVSPIMVTSGDFPPTGQANPAIDPATLAMAIKLVQQGQVPQPISETITLPEGEYTGLLKDGKPEGNGNLKYTPSNPNGFNVYKGGFVNGLPHGNGKMTWNDGKTYEGEWKNGFQHGDGIEVFPSQKEYVGQFENGKWHGVGTYRWKGPDNKTYVGQFSQGQFHGDATLTWMVDLGEGTKVTNCMKGIFNNNTFWNGFLQQQWGDHPHPPRQPIQFANGACTQEHFPEVGGCCNEAPLRRQYTTLAGPYKP